MPPLGPEQGYIFRITHIRNVPWILDHGLHCRNSDVVDPNFIPIGLPELIDRRTNHPIPIAPGGVLGDYVPFYFTPHSMMLYNINTGYNGVIRRANSDIAILVSTLNAVAAARVRFVFTDGHAYMQGSNYYVDIAELHRIDWNILKRRDFKKTPDDIDKSRRYQAEALVHRHLPAQALAGIACYNQNSADLVVAEIEQRRLPMTVQGLPSWYF